MSRSVELGLLNAAPEFFWIKGAFRDVYHLDAGETEVIVDDCVGWPHGEDTNGAGVCAGPVWHHEMYPAARECGLELALACCDHPEAD